MQNIPKLRFKEFEDEWEQKSLGDLLEFKNGINASKEKYGAGIKFINVLDILNNNYITHDNILGKVDIDKEQIKNNMVNYGDILFQRSSETREEVGTANVYLDTKEATFGGFVIRGKKISEYNPIFMNYLLKTSNSRREITNKAGGSTRYNVSQSVLSEAKITTTCLKEQEKIAEFLSNIDSRIGNQEEKIENIEETKKGLMQRLFSQEIRFKDENDQNYPDWEEKMLGDITKNGKAGGTPSTSNPSYYGGGIPFLSISDITSQGKYVSTTERNISKLGLENSSAWIVPEASLIYSMYASVGEVCINEVELTTSQAMYSMIIKDEFSLEFIYYLLKHFKENGLKRLIETGTQGNINAQTLKGLKFNIPSFPEQEKIADFLSIFDEKVDIEEEILETLKEIKKGLLQQMFV